MLLLLARLLLGALLLRLDLLLDCILLNLLGLHLETLSAGHYSSLLFGIFFAAYAFSIVVFGNNTFNDGIKVKRTLIILLWVKIVERYIFDTIRVILEGNLVVVLVVVTAAPAGLHAGDAVLSARHCLVEDCSAKDAGAQDGGYEEIEQQLGIGRVDVHREHASCVEL